MSDNQQPADDGDANPHNRFVGRGVPSDVADDDRGTNLPTRFVVNPKGKIAKNTYEKPSTTPPRFTVARRAVLLTILACAMLAVWKWYKTNTSPDSVLGTRLSTAVAPSVSQPPRDEVVQKDRNHDNAERQRDERTDSTPNNPHPNKTADQQFGPKVSSKPPPIASTKTSEAPPPSAINPNAAFKRLAFYFDRSETMTFSPESVIGFNPADYGVDPHVWNRFTTEARLAAIYFHSNLTRSGTGDQTLAMLARALAQECEDARNDPALQPYLMLEITTAKPSNPSDRQPAPGGSSQSTTVKSDKNRAVQTPDDRKQLATNNAFYWCALFAYDFDLSKTLKHSPEAFFRLRRADSSESRQRWDNATTKQKLQELYRVSERTVPGSGDVALENIFRSLMHLYDGDAEIPKAVRHDYVLLFVKEPVLNKSSRLMSDSAIEPKSLAALERCAFYLDHAAANVFTPEAIVGFNPETYGLESRVWEALPTFQKLAAIYLGADRASPGSGEKVLALLSQYLARLRDGAKYEPAFQSILNLKVNDNKIRFQLPDSPIPNSELTDDEIAKIEAMSKYLGNGAKLEGPFRELQRAFELSESDTRELLTLTRSVPRAIHYQLSRMEPKSRQRWFLSATSKIASVYPVVLIESSLRMEAAALIQLQPLLGLPQGIGGRPDPKPRLPRLIDPFQNLGRPFHGAPGIGQTPPPAPNSIIIPVSRIFTPPVITLQLIQSPTLIGLPGR